MTKRKGGTGRDEDAFDAFLAETYPPQEEVSVLDRSEKFIGSQDVISIPNEPYFYNDGLFAQGYNLYLADKTQASEITGGDIHDSLDQVILKFMPVRNGSGNKPSFVLVDELISNDSAELIKPVLSQLNGLIFSDIQAAKDYLKSEMNVHLPRLETERAFLEVLKKKAQEK